MAITLKLGHRCGESATYGSLGKAYHALGQFEQAVQYHEKALTIALEFGAQDLEGTT